MTELRLCLVGFGNAARAFCRLLSEKRDQIEQEMGCRVKITAVTTKSRGCLAVPEGIDPSALVASVEQCGRLTCAGEDPRDCAGMGLEELIARSGANVLLELSTLSVFDGQPAISHIETALQNGLHAITANKGPVAWDLSRLKAIAKDKGLELLYETVVMDGAPVFNLVRETLPGCRVLGFRGILNSTTNFILGEMEKGRDYQSAVIEAQRRGFAEADPSLDVDGWDAAAKTAAIANALLCVELHPTDVDRCGIAGITAEDVARAKEDGKRYKLICEAALEYGVAKARVAPILVPIDDVYGCIDATSSILSIRTDLMGEIGIIEKDPEIEQTAYGIYSDLLTLIRRIGPK